jgi:nucleoside-diphosphate-sugar epimerase
VGELVTCSMLGWIRQILAAAGGTAKLVTVPDAVVPNDMWLTRERRQHLLVDRRKITRTLGWQPTPAEKTIARSVAWHLKHPPKDADMDFGADDHALMAVTE